MRFNSSSLLLWLGISLLGLGVSGCWESQDLPAPESQDVSASDSPLVVEAYARPQEPLRVSVLRGVNAFMEMETLPSVSEAEVEVLYHQQWLSCEWKPAGSDDNHFMGGEFRGPSIDNWTPHTPLRLRVTHKDTVCQAETRYLHPPHEVQLTGRRTKLQEDNTLRVELPVTWSYHSQLPDGYYLVTVTNSKGELLKRKYLQAPDNRSNQSMSHTFTLKLEQPDTLQVDVYQLTEEYYTWFRNLRRYDQDSNEPFPKGNWEGECLGYFAGLHPTTETIWVDHPEL